MSIEIPVSFVDQFSANVVFLAEQRMSRLRGTVQLEDVTGESFAVERIGGVALNAVNERHGDTPLNSTPHTRRWGYIVDKDVADLIDKQDRVKLLINPDSAYTLRHAGALGRGFDDEIIRALGASVNEGRNGTTTTAYDTTNQSIASSSVGLTVAKLLEAKEKLDAAEVDDFIPRYFVCAAKQMTNLLNDDKVTSSDFNTVQALVQGKIDTYLGFKFIRSERLTKVSNDRYCFAYTQNAIRLGVAQAPATIVSDRPDKRHAKQVYSYMSLGAVRTEDVQVVRVLADES